MKIAYLVQVYPKLSETFVRNQIEGIAQTGGNEIHVFAEMAEECNVFVKKPVNYNIHYFKLPLNKIKRLKQAFNIIIRNFYKYPISVMNGLNLMKYGSEATSFRLLFALIYLSKGKMSKFDIIHCQFGRNGLLALALQKQNKMKGKLIVSIRGSDITRQALSREKEYRQLFEKADLFLPVCEYFKKELMKKGVSEDKIIVHHSGINVDQFGYIKRVYDGKVRFLSIGRLVEKKGIEYGLLALKELIKNSPNISYVYYIIGDGPLLKGLKDKVVELNLEQNVEFLGALPQTEVVSYLKSSDIFLAPCITATDGDKEGIPNVLKEAMATGMPVISTYHSGIPELVQDGVVGYLVDEKDYSSLAKAMEKMIVRKEEWVDMGIKARAIINDKFNINKLNVELTNIYKKVL